MIGRYLIRNPIKAAMMGAMDFGQSLLPIRKPSAPAEPDRILFANWAHLGDVTITLGAVRLARERFPNARIDYLASSWGRGAAAQSGLLDTVHVIDHPRMNRTDASPAAKRARYRETCQSATREILAIGYQVAIDFYFYFPPAHPLFRRWGIPVRIGYDSAGWGPSLTQPVRWDDGDRPISEHHAALINAAWPGIVGDPDTLRPHLEDGQIGSVPAELADIRYLVLHPGAGATFKDWGTPRWDSLIDLLSRHPRFSSYRIVLTGAGATEVACAETLADGRPDVITLAGRADWQMFVGVIAGAAAVICPDTVTGHVAAEVGTPVLSLFTGTNNAHQWAPNAENGRALISDVLCRPCHRVGCPEMACIRDISPEAVIASLEAMLL